MTSYHINPKTGDPGECKATKSCPFGGVDSHFSTKWEAMKHFEEQQNGAFSAPAEVKTPQRKAPTATVKPYMPAGIVVNDENNSHYTGKNYIGYVPMSELTKKIREEIKAAIKGNYLPKEATYSVAKRSGGHALTVSVTPHKKDQFVFDEIRFGGVNEEFKEVTSRINAILSSYNYNKSQSEYDYFDVGFYSTVTVKTELDIAWEEQYKASLKVKAILNKQKSLGKTLPEIESMQEFFIAKLDFQNKEEKYKRFQNRNNHVYNLKKDGLEINWEEIDEMFGTEKYVLDE